nr:peptidyl-prolyl cis-trans isomerase FKBP8-like isoform X1 [Leptinotarsa decemlineata]
MSDTFIKNEKFAENLANGDIHNSESISENSEDCSEKNQEKKVENSVDDPKEEWVGNLQNSESISENNEDCSEKNQEKKVENSVDDPKEEWVGNIQNSESISENNEDCSEKNQEKKVENSVNDPKEEWVDLLGSEAIMKKIIKEGLPDSRPERNEICRINYVCCLEDETVVETANNFELQLGESDVIQGLDVSLGLMNLNEKCRLKIEPRLAFGKKGLPPHIPSEAVLIYDIELVAVEKEQDIEEMTIEQRKLKGNKKRQRGNWWYSRGENNLAIQCYRRALDYLDEVEGGITGPLSENAKKEVTDADLQSLLEDRVSVCNNMAAAQIKMELYEAALNSLQIVLRCQPDNLKAHFRKAKVYIGKNDLPAAMKWLQKAKELAPNDSEIQKEITVVGKLLEKQKATEREVARRMFNGPKKDKDLEKIISRKSKVQFFCRHQCKYCFLKFFQVRYWATIGAVIAVGVGYAAYRFK